MLSKAKFKILRQSIDWTLGTFLFTSIYDGNKRMKMNMRHWNFDSLVSYFVLLTFTPNITSLQHQEPGSCNCDLHQCSLLTQFVHCLLLTRCNVCVRKIEESWSSIRFLKHISAYQHNISTHISDVNPEIKYIATEISRTLPQAIFHQVNCETSMGSPVWEQLAILSNQVPLKYRLPLNFLF